MSENVVPMFPEHEAIQKSVLEFVEWMRTEIAANRISALCVRGVDVDGDEFQYDIIPVEGNAPTLRYVMIGQLEEAKAFLIGEP